MDTLDIIRELERDEALRASLRAVLLGDDILSLPNEIRLLAAEVRKLAESQQRTEEAQKRTDETVKELASAQKRTEEALVRTDETVKELVVTVAELAEAQKRTDVTVGELKESVNRLSESLGVVAEEESCAAVLLSVAHQKGWTELDLPGPIDVGDGELAVRGRFDTPEGEIVILAEAKSRLRGSHVTKWANRVKNPSWQSKFLYPDFEGKVLPYMYGTLIYSDARDQAIKHGIGIIKYDGEHLAPRPL